MGRLAPNQALAVEVIARLRAAGVGTFCLCPGGRNAPLVQALDDLGAAGVEVLDFFEERSAAFFALGRARRDRRPVAVVTTSGTASAELLPAMVEAYYSCTPLVAVTADRPRTYRGTGAPQTIEQPDLFGVYARQRVDLDATGTGWVLGPAGPSHVNVCFDEPLLAAWQASPANGHGHLEADDPAPGAASGAACRAPASGRSAHASGAGGEAALVLDGCTRPLVLVGALTEAEDRRDALDFCRRLAAPVLAEASSYLKPFLGDLLLAAGETAARHGFQQQAFDAVIRLGDIPTFRLWRDLESTWRVPMVSASRKPWRGLTRGIHMEVPAGLPLCAGLPRLPPFPEEPRRALVSFDRDLATRTECLLADYPESEPAHVRRLSAAIPAGSFLYLGNSQPIREWNRFALPGDTRLTYGENRGANGIDGQLSTFLGGAFADRENWAVVGDLTALYDLASPWALRHVAGPVRIAILNNGGGRIFQGMFDNPRFQNRHAITFEAFAALWGLDYTRQLDGAPLGPRVLVELRPDQRQTEAFWKAVRARTKA